MENPGEEIAAMFYADWYKKDVSPKLTKEQKEKLLKELSDYSLEHVIYLEKNIELDKFPLLKPYSHTGAFSGLQLYVVMSELFNELHAEAKLKTPYPHFPEKKREKG